MEHRQPNVGRSEAVTPPPLRTDKIEALLRRIEELEAEKAAKEQELRQLQSEPASLFEGDPRTCEGATPMSPAEKIELFLRLFGARRDVYPRYWENRILGKKGYSPACASGYTGAREKHYLPLDERVVEAHLRS